MSDWEIIREEASIVLIGSMNPKIFHPEWFIRKEIVEEWDYSQDEIISLPDLAQIELPNERKLTVLLNKFSILTPLATEYQSIKDLVTHTFSLLSETPINQIGMNFNSVIKIPDQEKWTQLGRNLAPADCWKQAAAFVGDIDESKQKEFGLWDLTMNFPRPDDLEGYIRPKINVFPQAGLYTLQFSINNHVEVKDSNANSMIKVLESNWDQSLFFAKNLTKNVMESQLNQTI
ncbi:hypothetical protein GO003_007735 [Methylicorpusculum oleiharenae]|uniref:hypothetical protein n=1 Tax=Methylicorpusculum oleiharenae TaxID=1338687 RepID=UPI00135A09B2|nr:hypothetical protein [Methylicorpusculum oleiharenae]MCD2450273.1 hypothetical protein [Methylicorpusculum oleiharenae]